MCRPEHELPGLLFLRENWRLREFVWVGVSPPRWHGPQVRAPWHRGGHGALDVVGPVDPPCRESGRGYAGVYTDRREWPLGVTTARMQSAPFVTSPAQSAPFGHVAVASPVQTALLREAAGAECAFT